MRTVFDNLHGCLGSSRAPLLGLLLLAAAGQTLAALGRTPSSLSAAVAASPPVEASLSAVQRKLAFGPYTSHETQLESGTTVREYATPAGLVFAVAWRGPVLPDLSLLLGDYFATFKRQTEQARTLGRRGSPVQLQRDGLIVKSGGRMRNFSGYAYAPALVPGGVAINDVLR